MSGNVVTIQVGQCGNQIGTSLFTTLSTSMTKKKTSTSPSNQQLPSSFFRPSKNPNQTPIARSVLIDMEPKVIQDCFLSSRKSGSYRFLKSNSFYKQSGSANNWAFGYTKQGPSCKNELKNVVRREVEKCDFFEGFLVLTSLAGGTGSGVGTFVSEQLRDLYSESFQTNMIIWPYDEGEITLQNYNTVLSLNHLCQTSDCIWFFRNDMLNDICLNYLALKRPSFDHMNQIVATSTASVLLPSKNQTSTRFKPIYDLVSHLCSHPTYKFITTKFYPFIPERSKMFQSDRWSGILKQTYQMMLSKRDYVQWHIPRLQINKLVSSLLHVRGNIHDTEDRLDLPLKPFLHPKRGLFTDWYSSGSQGCEVYRDEGNFRKNEKSAGLTMNSQAIVPPLDLILSKSSRMFHTKAYLHQYEKYGIEKDDFVRYFRKLEQVLFHYKNL